MWRRVFRKVKYGFIMPDHNDPHSSSLPCELGVGSTCTLFLSFDKNCFLLEPMTHIGITDSFGRTHWAPKKAITNMRKKYEGYQKFGRKGN